LALTLMASPVAAQLVINEIMQNPAAVTWSWAEMQTAGLMVV
jgi:hypothetical protein